MSTPRHNLFRFSEQTSINFEHFSAYSGHKVPPEHSRVPIGNQDRIDQDSVRFLRHLFERLAKGDLTLQPVDLQSREVHLIPGSKLTLTLALNLDLGLGRDFGANFSRIRPLIGFLHSEGYRR